MNPNTAVFTILGATTVLGLFIIFAGCNMIHPEFDFNGNGADSIPVQCAEYEGDSQVWSKCIDRKEKKESTCNDYFWWLRY